MVVGRIGASQNAHCKGQLIEIISSAIEVYSKWTDDSMVRMLHLGGSAVGFLRERESIILAAMKVGDVIAVAV